MGINKESDIQANLQIGPTSAGMVRIYVEAEGVDLPMDFDPEEAREIAEEILAAAARCRGKRQDLTLNPRAVRSPGRETLAPAPPHGVQTSERWPCAAPERAWFRAPCGRSRRHRHRRSSARFPQATARSGKRRPPPRNSGRTIQDSPPISCRPENRRGSICTRRSRSRPWAQRHHVDAQPRFQRQFLYRNKIMAAEVATNAAGQKLAGLKTFEHFHTLNNR